MADETKNDKALGEEEIKEALKVPAVNLSPDVLKQAVDMVKKNISTVMDERKRKEGQQQEIKEALKVPAVNLSPEVLKQAVDMMKENISTVMDERKRMGPQQEIHKLADVQKQAGVPILESRKTEQQHIPTDIRPVNSETLDVPTFMKKVEELEPVEQSKTKRIFDAALEKLAPKISDRIKSGDYDYEFPWMHGDKGDKVGIVRLGSLEGERKGSPLEQILIKKVTIGNNDPYCFIQKGQDNEIKKIRLGFGKVPTKDEVTGKEIPKQDRDDIIGRYFNNRYRDLDELGVFGELKFKSLSYNFDKKKPDYCIMAEGKGKEF